MKADNRFGIDFVIRLHKKDKTKALLYARITVNKQSREVSLKEPVDPESWDAAAEQVKGKTVAAKALNRHIEEVRFKIREKYRLLSEKEAILSAEAVKLAYLGNHAIQRPGHTLCELMALHTKIQFPKLKFGTTKNYETTERYVRRYLSETYKSGDISVSDLDFAFITELEFFIRNRPIKEEDPCVGNGVYKHLERLKKMVSWAKQLKWIKENPFSEFKLEYKKCKRRKLTLQEIALIENQDLNNQKLDLVRDLFLFSCYTGFSFGDVTSLKKTDFEQLNGRLFCKIYRQKSEELSFVPLFNAAIELIKKYVGHPKAIQAGTIFPRVSNQEVNRCLKIIREICQIEKGMSFHIARHTFATTVTLKNGVPIETVSKMLGHTKLSTTQIYAEVDEEKIMADMAGIETRFISQKKELPKSDGFLKEAKQ